MVRFNKKQIRRSCSGHPQKWQVIGSGSSFLLFSRYLLANFSLFCFSTGKNCLSICQGVGSRVETLGTSNPEGWDDLGGCTDAFRILLCDGASLC